MKVVPYAGVLKLGQTGKPVVAVKRALWRAHVYPHLTGTPFTPIWGPYAKIALQKFQRLHGIPAGLYGKPSHEKLAPFYDAYAVSMLVQAKPPPVPQLDPRRLKILAGCTLAYNNRAFWHYTQGSARMMIVRQHLELADLGTHVLWEDCSSGATGLYYVAGAPDPNGRGYDTYGYTGTLAQHGRRITIAAAKAGDLVFYGSGFPYSHVAVYLGFGRVWSFGSENGPYVLPVAYRRDMREVRSYLP